MSPLQLYSDYQSNPIVIQSFLRLESDVSVCLFCWYDYYLLGGLYRGLLWVCGDYAICQIAELNGLSAHWAMATAVVSAVADWLTESIL